MPRIRTIKPEFPQSESMGKVSRDARLTFVQMWTLADDSGRLRGNSRMLASLLYPYDDDAPSLIEGWLQELERENCITRYQSEDGGKYIEIRHWSEHQKIDKPSVSRLPGPHSGSPRESSRILSSPRECSSLDQGPRTKEGTKDQGPGKGGEWALAPSPSRGAPPTLEEVSEYIQEAGLSQVDPAAFVDHYQANGWKQSNGQAIKDWQAACRGWNRRQSQFGARNQPRAGPLKGEALVAENRETIKRYAERVKNGTVGDLFGGAGHAGGGPGPADKRAAVGSVSGRISGPVG